MTDTNNWLQEVERATRDWDDESKDALICGENMCHLLRQAVTMVKAQGADVLPPRVEPVDERAAFDNWSENFPKGRHNLWEAWKARAELHPPSSSEPAGVEARQPPEFEKLMCKAIVATMKSKGQPRGLYCDVADLLAYYNERRGNCAEITIPAPPAMHSEGEKL